MGKRIAPGEKLPFFQYDTPYSAANSFRALLAQQAPLVLVFMSNFGHPVTRTFVSRYAHTRHLLTGGGFALVVRSQAEKLAANVGPRTLPYPLLCDADGVLYDYLDIPVRAGFWRTCSLEAWQILKKARRQGYDVPAGAPQQMPLTLILDADGTVLFCHYGASLTDVPEDCGAMQSLLDELDLLPGDAEEEAEAAPARPAPRPAHAPANGDDYDDAEAAPGWEDDAPRRAGLTHTALLGLLDDPEDDD